jgi:hypothetical protein
VRYLLLIYADEQAQADIPPDRLGELMKAWWEYEGWLRDKGWHRGGEALQPIATGTTVRVRNGETLTTDGPFAETKEQLGGFYLIECDDLDQAIEAAARLPASPYGSIEIRPIQEFEPPEHDR